MPTPLPYLVTLKNIPTLFTRIASAKIPDKFTHQFLQTTIGLKGTGDRPLIPLLRALGFIDQSGTPTPSYNLLKSNDKRRATIAAGVRQAYGPLFDAEGKAHEQTGERLKSLVAQVAGTDDELTRRIAGTFSALVRLGDFTADGTAADTSKKPALEVDEEAEKEPAREERRVPKGLRADFNYNIHVHLPSNGSEETYLNIFNAIRKTFQ